MKKCSAFKGYLKFHVTLNNELRSVNETAERLTSSQPLLPESLCEWSQSDACIPLTAVGRCSAKPPESLPTLERLAQATGGTEKSWYRCVFPFGVISLVIGMAGTGVTFTFNTLLQTKVVSVALLCVGVVMLLVAAVCWRAHRLRRRKKKEGGFFIADQGTFPVMDPPG
uniref:Transmembrane protein 100 n=1 Tax=Astatotilapia calliptera TaxID=8154 RepID=A0A3P8QQ82_ASTCA